MTSNVFCFTMMSLVISRLSRFRLAQIRREGSSMKVLFYLLRSWLRLNGTSVFSFWIQKFSLITNISRSASLEQYKFTSLSMMACLLKLGPFSWKCLQDRMELGFLVSFLWLFNPKLNAVSAFLAYCILHNMHSIRQIMYSLLQSRLKKMLNVRFVCWLMNVFAVSTWLQHRVLVPNKHGVHFPILELILNFLTSPFSICVLPIFLLDFSFSKRLWLGVLGIIPVDFCWFGECSSLYKQLM